MTAIPIVHLSYNEGLSSVFAAQVARPMSHLRTLGYPISLAVFAPIGQFLRQASRRHWERQLTLIRNELGLEMARLPSPPSRAAELWKPAVLFRHWLHRRRRHDGKIILHCRGSRAAEIALSIRRGDPRVMVIFDCRGWDGTEYLYRMGYQAAETAPLAVAEAAKERHELQGRVAVESDFVLCVSQCMKRTIMETWPVNCDNTEVVPCCTDVLTATAIREAREASRSRLGLENQFVISYLGSLSQWQMPRESLGIVKAIQEMRPDSFFLGITPNPAKLCQLAVEVGLHPDRYRILSVPHQEVPRFLAAADAGLLIRDSSIVNRVASPVKFAEYLACGVPVLLTGSVGDYSELVRECRLGAVLPDPETTDETREILKAFLGEKDHESRRERCHQTAARLLSWKRATESLPTIYDRLQVT